MRDRLADCARDLGIEVQVQRLEASTRTVADAASAVGCEESEIAKSIVFVADGDPVVFTLTRQGLAWKVTEVRVPYFAPPSGDGLSP